MTTESPAQKGSRVGLGVRIGISLAVLAAVLAFVDKRQLLALLAGLDFRWLAVALVANVVSMYMTASLLSAITGGRLSAAKALRVNFISAYFSIFLPGDVTSGLASRLRYLGLPTWQDVVVATIFERLSLLAGFSALALVAYYLSTFRDALGWLPAILPTLVIVAAASLLSAISGAKLSPFPRSLRDWLANRVMRGKPAIALRLGYRSAVLTVLTSVAMCVVPFSIMHGLGRPISFADSVVFGYLLTMAQLPPIFFAGIGVRDVSAVALLGVSGIPKETAIAFSTTLLGLVLLLALIGGGLQLSEERQVQGPT